MNTRKYTREEAKERQRQRNNKYYWSNHEKVKAKQAIYRKLKKEKRTNAKNKPRTTLPLFS